MKGINTQLTLLEINLYFTDKYTFHPGGSAHDRQEFLGPEEAVQDDQRDTGDAGRVHGHDQREQGPAGLGERPVRDGIQNLQGKTYWSSCNIIQCGAST